MKTQPVKFNTRKPQTYLDPWDGNKERTVLYNGQCVYCDIATYYFTTGNNDPRGILGRHTSYPLVAKEYDMVGPDIPACFECMNTAERYHSDVVQQAKAHNWRKP